MKPASRFERFGFFRVLVAGVFVVVLIDVRLLVSFLLVLGLGVGVVFWWRLFGDWLHELRHRAGGRRRVWP